MAPSADLTARRLELFVKLGQTLFDTNGAWRNSTLSARGLFAELSWQAMLQAREFIRYDGRTGLASLVRCRPSELKRLLPKMISAPVPLVSLLHDTATGAERIRVVGIRMLWPRARPWEDERLEFEAWRAEHSEEPVRNSDAIDWGEQAHHASSRLATTRHVSSRLVTSRHVSGPKSATANAPQPDVDVRPRERSTSLPPLPPPQVEADTSGVDGVHDGNGPQDGGVKGNGHSQRHGTATPEQRLYASLVDGWLLSPSSKAYARELVAEGLVKHFLKREPKTLLAWARGVARALEGRGIRSPWLCLAARLQGKARSTEPARKDRAWVKAELARMEAHDA